MTAIVRTMWPVACLCALAVGCGGSGSGADGNGAAGGGPGGGGPGGGGPGGGAGSGESPPTGCADTHLVASETNDYSFSSTITLNPVTVAQMSNLEFDWSGLTKDFQGHDISPADLGMAIVMFWGLPLQEFETALNADALYTSDLILAPPLSLELAGAPTSAKLYDFTINTTPVTPDMINPYFDATAYPPSQASFIVAVEAGTVLGRDIRMMQAFSLDANSQATQVPITNDSTKLDYTADLHSLQATSVPAATSALTLDWSAMTTNALGREFTRGYITDAMVGHYAETPAELEQKFLDLDRIALATYRAEIPSGSELDFTTLEDENGASFPGVDDTGTWVVSLLCGNCRNPAPWYMAILKPCSN